MLLSGTNIVNWSLEMEEDRAGLRYTRTIGALLGAMLATAAPLHGAGAAGPAAGQGGTILIAGDSTAADYAAERYPQTGWGMMLKCGLSPDVTVRNLAYPGRSTKSFIAEGRWDAVMTALHPGDTVLIQFAHNDANRDKPERFARAWTDYRDNLLRFVWMVRGARATPVLLTPVARRSFDDRGKAKADFAEYSDVVREVASKTGTPMIDLESLSRAWIDAAGVAGSRGLYLHYSASDHARGFPNGIDDDTHFSELGARGVANLVAGALRALNVPVSPEVLADRPDLLRTVPLGSYACR